MKIDRLIAIIMLLLQHEKTTATALAQRFEVSKRTIHRDMEDLCKAGVPIVTTQGAGGGIALMDSYQIEKTFFSAEELKAVYAGLSSLDSVAQSAKYQSIMDKFSAHCTALPLHNGISIDLSSHYKETLAPKIELLRTAIETATRVSFCYHNKAGARTVTADPYLVVFRWSDWYLLAFDEGADCFKLYKLRRMSVLEATEDGYGLREIPPQTLQFDQYFTDETQAVVLFEPSEAYRLLEEYGPDSFTQMEDGKLRFSFRFTNEAYLLTWVLGFGEKAELQEPRALRETLRHRLEQAAKQYLE